MANRQVSPARPALHLLTSESELVASLALQAEHKHPLVSVMLLTEIERAQLHEPGTLPPDVVALGSEVSFVDERSQQERTVHLVLPATANIEAGRVSIMTPMGAALYGMTSGTSIQWPDRGGNVRQITITHVRQLSTPVG